MKHIILLILLTLGVLAEEVGVPYVKQPAYMELSNSHDVIILDNNFIGKQSKIIDLENGLIVDKFDLQNPQNIYCTEDQTCIVDLIQDENGSKYVLHWDMKTKNEIKRFYFDKTKYEMYLGIYQQQLYFLKKLSKTEVEITIRSLKTELTQSYTVQMTNCEITKPAFANGLLYFICKNKIIQFDTQKQQIVQTIELNETFKWIDKLLLANDGTKIIVQLHIGSESENYDDNASGIIFHEKLLIIDTKTGKEIQKTEVLDSPIIKLSPDSKKMLVITRSIKNHGTYLYELKNNKIIELGENLESWYLTFTRDSKNVMMKHLKNDKNIGVYNCTSGKLIETLTLLEKKNALASSHDLSRVYVAGETGTITAWDMNQGAKLFSVKAHQKRINKLIVSHDDKTLYSGSDDKSIKSWDAFSGVMKKEYKFGKEVGSFGIQTFEVNHDETKLFVPHDVIDNKLSFLIVDIEDKTHTIIIDDNNCSFLSCSVHGINLSKDGSRLYLGTASGDIQIRNQNDGKIQKTISRFFPGASDHRPSIISEIDISDIGDIIASGTYFRVLPKNADVQKYTNLLSKSGNIVNGAAFVNHKREIIFGTWHGLINLYDIEQERLIDSYDFGESTSAIGYLDRNKIVVTGDGGAVRLLDFASKKSIVTLYNFPDDEWIVMTNEGFFNASSNAHKYLFMQNKFGKSSPITDVEYRKFFQPKTIKNILQKMINFTQIKEK